MFNLVTDDLIKRLCVSGLGFNIPRFFIECILYADDVLLLFRLIVKLQKMLDISYEFGIKRGFKFNSLKFSCVLFRENVNQFRLSPMFIDGN